MTHEPITFAEPEDLEQDDVADAAKAEEEDYLPHFVHEDGSHTVIKQDTDPSSPRDDDGNVVHLVVKNRDYIDIDDSDSGIEEARDRWDWLEHNGHRHYRQPDASGSWHNEVDRALVRLGLDREALVKRYVAMFRPDIAGYRDEWSVNGTMQGDTNYGYAYVLRSDLDAMGLTVDYMAEHDLTVDSIIDGEVKTYGQYHAGEVYGAVHLRKGEPIVVYGEQGAYVTGYKVVEDSCWGFLGYDDMKEIAAQFTDSPVVEDVS